MTPSADASIVWKKQSETGLSEAGGICIIPSSTSSD
jgi:hypothetical protein